MLVLKVTQAALEIFAFQTADIDRDEAPVHFFRHTAINSPHCQEFMV